MSRVPDSARFDALFAALTVTLGLQTFRAFFPLILYVYGTRPGISSVDMGLLAIGVFLTAWLVAVPLRLFGPAGAVRLAATVLALTRLLLQFSDPGRALWLSALGTVAFLLVVPCLLAFARGSTPEGSARLTQGLLFGLALDVAIAGAFWTWDPIWQRSAAAGAVTVAVVLIYLALLGGFRRADVNRSRTDVPLGTAWTLLGLGPILLLHMLLFQNVARLTAVTGWPLPGALLFILAVDAVAIGAAAGVRRGVLALLSAVVLIPAASLARGSGAGAALGLVIGSVSAAVVTVAIIGAQGRRALRGGLARTAVGWGLGMLLLVVPAFLYYVGYDLKLPFDNRLLPPILAAVAAVAALGPGRAIGAVPVMRRAPGAVFLVLLLVPLVLWVGGRPPQAQAGSGWPVRVMSYNLHQGYGISGAQDLEALARTIEEAGAEIVALQEVSRGWLVNGSTEMLTWLSRRLRMPYVWGPAADAIWGNAILSRRPILASGNAELPRGGAPMRRAVMWADVDLGRGERLLVIATHFHHVEGHGQIREPQAAATVSRWNRQGRTVLMGDLNALPGAREIAILRDAGLRDAFALAGQGEGFTYRSDKPYERIDYIWISPDLAARDFNVLPGQASDHLGIAVTVAR
ncbi:MAG: endonuclease/exonuclease/phosphatase family protein [bacterium]|nr:endonuclease/exonuclease/phosphatase family protein [bacterium]